LRFSLPLKNDFFSQKIKIDIRLAQDSGAAWRVHGLPKKLSLSPGQSRVIDFSFTAIPKKARYPLPAIEIVLWLGITGTNIVKAKRKISLYEKLLGLRPVLTVSQTSKKPVLDGRLTDQLWKGAPTVPVLGLMNGCRSICPKTSVWLAYDKNALYLAFLCAEPKTAKIKTVATKRDGRLWKDDSVEIMLDGNGDGQSYHQIIVNTAGVLYDGKGFDKKVDIKGLRAQTAVGQGAWFAEVAVPWKGLGLDGPPKKAGMLLVRNRLAGSKHTILQFPLNPKGNHQSAMFTEFRLQK